MLNDEKGDRTSAENLIQIAKELTNQALDIKREWSSEKQVAAVNILIKAIRDVSRKRIGIGVQDVEEVKNTLKNGNFGISSDIDRDTTYGFYRVTLFAFFSREERTKSVYAEIVINRIKPDEFESQIYSIAPLNVNEKVALKKTFGLNPKIELCEVKVDPGISYAHTKEYTEIHPYIIANFDAKSYAKWQYETTLGIKEIVGTQTLELIIKQSLNTCSEWIAVIPEVVLSWRNRWIAIKSIFNPYESVQPAIEIFSVPKKKYIAPKSKLSNNIQLLQIQSFAQTSENNKDVSNADNTKNVINTAAAAASGQKVVLRGIESSKIFNNATINTGEKPQGVSILTNRPDGTIYTGVVTFTATKPVEVGISYRLPIDNNTFSQIDTKSLGNLYTGYHNDKGEAGTPGILSTASVIVPDYGTHTPYFSASIPFVGDSLWLKTINGEPFVVAYAVSADIVQPLNVVNLDGAIKATKDNTTYGFK